MNAKNNTACVIPLSHLVVDSDGCCRLCRHHDLGLGSIMDAPDIGSTWKAALRS